MNFELVIVMNVYCYAMSSRSHHSDTQIDKLYVLLAWHSTDVPSADSISGGLITNYYQYFTSILPKFCLPTYTYEVLFEPTLNPSNSSRPGQLLLAQAVESFPCFRYATQCLTGSVADLTYAVSTHFNPATSLSLFVSAIRYQHS